MTRRPRLPRYEHGTWVSVSRHKFDGLVGHQGKSGAGVCVVPAWLDGDTLSS